MPRGNYDRIRKKAAADKDAAEKAQAEKVANEKAIIEKAKAKEIESRKEADKQLNALENQRTPLNNILKRTSASLRFLGFETNWGVNVTRAKQEVLEKLYKKKETPDTSPPSKQTSHHTDAIKTSKQSIRDPG